MLPPQLRPGKVDQAVVPPETETGLAAAVLLFHDGYCSASGSLHAVTTASPCAGRAAAGPVAGRLHTRGGDLPGPATVKGMITRASQSCGMGARLRDAAWVLSKGEGALRFEDEEVDACWVRREGRSHSLKTPQSTQTRTHRDSHRKRLYTLWRRSKGRATAGQDKGRAGARQGHGRVSQQAGQR